MNKKTLKKRIQNARWRLKKRESLAHGMIEVALNTLTTPGYAYPEPDRRGWTPMKVTPCLGCDAYATWHKKQQEAHG